MNPESENPESRPSSCLRGSTLFAPPCLAPATRVSLAFRSLGDAWWDQDDVDAFAALLEAELTEIFEKLPDEAQHEQFNEWLDEYMEMAEDARQDALSMSGANIKKAARHLLALLRLPLPAIQEGAPAWGPGWGPGLGSGLGSGLGLGLELGLG